MPEDHSLVLRVTGLSKRYGSVQALDNVSFSIHRGEVLGLIGPNGSGKTTLFECLGGVLAPDAGEVAAGAPRSPAERRERLLFYVPDGIVPWPAQRAGWVLDYTRAVFGGEHGDRDAVFAGLELAPLLGSTIASLSKGQRKRVLLAIGLLARQPVLLFDEPFDGLDLRQTRQAAALLRTVAAAGRTLFLSIHQISDAARVCDRFVLLSGGRTRGEGSASELARRAGQSGPQVNLEEVFLALT